MKCHKMTNTAEFHFYEGSKLVKLMERESKMADSRDWRDGVMESYCVMSTDTQVSQDEKNSGNGWLCWSNNNVNVFHTWRLYT